MIDGSTSLYFACLNVEVVAVLALALVLALVQVFTSTALTAATSHQGQPNTRTMPMANQLPPGQQQIYDHFEDTESSYSLDDLAEDFPQYSKHTIGRFLVRLRGRGFLRYEELSGLYTCVPEHEREDEEQPVEAPPPTRGRGAEREDEEMSLLDISLLVAGGLFLPIRLPCFFPGVMEHSPACLRWAASLAQPMTQHVFLIEMGKNLTLTLVLLCAWASLLQTSVATKKAVLRAVASLMSIQNLWAAFVAHGLASPEMLGELVVAAALMVAAILLTAPDAKAGKKK